MKITGSNSYVMFNLEDGYILKMEGEMLAGRQFVAYKDSATWQPPHEKEKPSLSDIDNVISKMKKKENDNSMKIIFE